MQNVPLSGASAAVAWEQVALALPFPAFVLDARAGGFPLLLVNAAFGPLARDPAQTVGHPIDTVVDCQVLTPDAASLSDLVAATAESGVAQGGRRVEIRTSGTAEGPTRLHCWLSLTPLLDDSGVAAVVGTLVDDLGEGLSGPRQARRDVLRTMASTLASQRPLDEVLAEAAAACAQTAGAQSAAILLSDGSNEFTVAGFSGPGELPRAFTIGHGAEGIIDVAWGRTRLVWSADGDQSVSLPFFTTLGWRRALVVGMRIGGGGFGLVAAGDPVEGQWDDGTPERLELAAVFIGAAVERAQLRGHNERIEELLRGAVTTSSGLAAAATPGEVREHLVAGIVADMHLPGAALWLADPSDETAPQLVAAAGVPSDVLATLAQLPVGDPVTEAVAGNRRWHARGDAVSAQAWPGHQLLVVEVPAPPGGALGVFSQQPLPGPAVEIFANLTQALCAAVQSTTQHQRTRSVVDALQRQLQPRLATAPAGLDTGYIYRSATAGVPIGGDFLDLFTTAGQDLGIACGDVSGKGIEAATLSAMAVYSLRAFALQGASPKMVLALMDSAVEAQIGDDRFATMVYGRLDPRAWTIELAVAGHPPPVLVGPGGVSVVDVPAGVPVGMLGDSSYEPRVIALPVGHSLILYTDGVIEARSGDEQRTLFGMERFLQALHELRGEDAQAIADGVWQRVQQWSSGKTTDDCAIVVVQRQSQGAG